MDLLIIIAALVFLMFVAYRGYSVILFAPIAALGAVLLVSPAAVAPAFSEVFMVRLADFLKLYFPVFMLGAVFGKLIELAGYSKSLASAIIKQLGERHAILAIVLVCAALTYGGVSLFVVVFAVYPFAAELFRHAQIPKRLIPGAIALGAFSFTMSALPGSPQIQNIIPTSFFGTTTWAAPWLGLFGALFSLGGGLWYLQHRCTQALQSGESYGTELRNEPKRYERETLPSAWIAALPLILVAVMNAAFTELIPYWYGDAPSVQLTADPASALALKLEQYRAIWAVLAALLIGIASVLLLAGRALFKDLMDGIKEAIAGALLAALNTASEYGFGAVIALLPGFALIAKGMATIGDPLIGEAVAVTTLAGITGSASGGMSIALATLSEGFIARADAAGIPMEVLHRVAAMASGGMDTLPHNGAVITLLAVTGLSHKESYRDILVVTLITTLAVFAVIALYYLTGIV